MANPVGTGPYRLKEWRRGQDCARGESDVSTSAFPKAAFPRIAQSSKATREKLPFAGRVEISIIENPIRGSSRSSKAIWTTWWCLTSYPTSSIRRTA
jgi:hypothetical protein